MASKPKTLMKKSEVSVKKDDERDFVQMRKDRKAALIEAVKEKYSDATMGSLRRPTLERVSSGSFVMDYFLGGGFPFGRIVVIYGSEGGGKTTTVLKTIADAQRRSAITNRYLWEETDPENQVPMTAAFIDAENAMDSDFAEALGVDVDAVDMSVPTSAEAASDILQSTILSAAYDIVVLDSVAAMEAEAEFAAETGDWQTGLHPRIVNKMIRKVQSSLNMLAEDPSLPRTPLVIIVNQVRQKTNTKANESSKVLPGGMQQKFQASVIIEMRKGATEFRDADKIDPRYSIHHFRLEKSKVSRFGRVPGEFKICLNEHEKDFKFGQILDSDPVLVKAEEVGLFRKLATSKWELCGEKFSRKSDLMDKFILNDQNYRSLKRKILMEIYPKNEKFKEEQEVRSLDEVQDGDKPRPSGKASGKQAKGKGA